MSLFQREFTFNEFNADCTVIGIISLENQGTRTSLNLRNEKNIRLHMSIGLINLFILYS